MDKESEIQLTRVAFVGSAIVVFIIGLLLAMDEGIDDDLGLIALLAVVILSANFFYHTGLSREGGDERLARVANQAMSLSWFLTLMVVLLMVALEGLAGIGLTISQILGIAVMVMVTSMVLDNEIGVRRGEVE